MALYAAKNSGRNRWIGIRANGNSQPEHIPVEGDLLQQAIDQQQLTLLMSEPSETALRWQ